MATHNDYAGLIINLLNKVPQKYQDRNLEMLYQQGFLIGVLADLMMKDSQIAHTVKATLDKVAKK